MRIKTSKKNAMALILVLVIITSLAAIIAASIKVLVVSNKYSIDRLSKAGDKTKASGLFVCYKKFNGSNYDLYQSRVEFKPDGSVASENLDKKVTDCSFEIPQGIKDIKVILIGAGSKGSPSSVKAIKDNETSCGNLSDNNISKECRDVKDKLLNGELKLDLESKLEVQKSPTEYKDCPGENIEFTKFSDFLSSSGSAKYSNYFNSLNNKTKTCKYEDLGDCVCNPSTTDGDGNIKYIDIYVNNTKSASLRNSVSYEYEYIKNILNSISYAFIKTIYEISVGQPGEPAIPAIATIPNIMYSDSNGGSTIKIPKNNIAEPDGPNNTSFTYYYINQKGEYVTETLNASSAVDTERKITRYIKSESQLENIPARDGKIPVGFEIPSSLKLNDLYAGYIKDDGSAVKATYFGASGAAGPIKIDGNIFTTCYQYKCKYNGNTVCDIENSDPICTDEKSYNTVSTGGPGAIIISW